MSDEPEHAIGYLCSSPVRVDLLAQLVDAPARPADLVESTDASRTTVHRTLTDFLSREWCRRDDGEYVATGLGRLVLESYHRARSQFHTLDRLSPVLAHLDDVDGLDPAWFETASFEVATEENPQRPMEWYADLIEAFDGDRFRGIAPVVNRQLMAMHRPLVRADTPTELLIGESTFEFVAERYPEQLEGSIAVDSYTLYVTPESPSLGISLYGEAVFLGTYDDRTRLVGMLSCTDDRLRDWAERRYRRYREGARRITADDVASE